MTAREAGCCGAFVKDYGHLLANDSAYAAKAPRISELACDLIEIMGKTELEGLGVATDLKLAFHCPCTLPAARRALTRLPSPSCRGNCATTNSMPWKAAHRS